MLRLQPYLQSAIGVLVLGILLSGGPAQADTALDLYQVFSRVPSQTWDRISYADYRASMAALDADWPPESSNLTPAQEVGWASAWQPDLLTHDLAPLGFAAYDVYYAVEAREGNSFALWLEGQFNVGSIAERLRAAGYARMPESRVEQYRAPEDSPWRQRAPYIAVPDGRTLFIGGSAVTLQALLDIYDGVLPPLLEDVPLLQRLVEVPPYPTSAILRLDQRTAGCALESSQVMLHGLAYDAERATWQYILNAGYADDMPRNQLGVLANGIEFSTYPIQPAFQGVLGQYTAVASQTLFESRQGDDIAQIIMRLRDAPNVPSLPMWLGRLRDTCALFQAPPAAATTLALSYLPDLSANRLDVLVRFGNAEQALYNAGLDEPIAAFDGDMSAMQRASLDSTWRTVLAYENAFPAWFGFAPQRIQQSVELTLDIGDYVRILWGDFNREGVEDALLDTGYVPIEQYQGARIFTLRETPESGGVMLRSLTQTAATPLPGVLIFTNNATNMRLALDIVLGNFSSALLRQRELVLTTQALQDATNAAVRRFVNPVSDGLVCGLPPYRVDALANVLRPDGWHFLYAVGFNSVLPEAETHLAGLAEALENSDYPMQGPGSETFGQLSEVDSAQIITDGVSTVLLVDLRVAASAQRASSFAQDLPVANLPPCVLGDVTQ